jgi:hypothetical protein
VVGHLTASSGLTDLDTPGGQIGVLQQKMLRPRAATQGDHGIVLEEEQDVAASGFQDLLPQAFLQGRRSRKRLPAEPCPVCRDSQTAPLALFRGRLAV